MSVLIIIEDKIYRITEKLYTRLRELRNEADDDVYSPELEKLVNDIDARKHGRFVGYVQFDWRW